MSLTVTKKDEARQAAAKLFCEQGYHATSVRDIAERIGIQGGSLYSHFASKDEMLWAVVSDAADRFSEAIGPIVISDRPILNKLREAIVAHVEIVTSDLSAAAVYTVEWRHLGEARRAEVTELRDRYEELWRTLVDRGIRDRVLAATDAASVSRFILSSLNYLFTWYRPDGPMTPEEVGAMMADYILDGIKRRTV